MPNFSAWLTDTQPLAATERAALAWRRILDKPTSITLRTAAGALRTAQTVRIEMDNRASVDNSPAGSGPRMGVIVYGIRDHATLPDTAMAEGDRFVVGDDQYTIQDIILTLGEIQGVAVANG